MLRWRMASARSTAACSSAEGLVEELCDWHWKFPFQIRSSMEQFVRSMPLKTESFPSPSINLNISPRLDLVELCSQG